MENEQEPTTIPSEIPRAVCFFLNVWFIITTSLLTYHWNYWNEMHYNSFLIQIEATSGNNTRFYETIKLIIENCGFESEMSPTGYCFGSLKACKVGSSSLAVGFWWLYLPLAPTLTLCFLPPFMWPCCLMSCITCACCQGLHTSILPRHSLLIAFLLPRRNAQPKKAGLIEAPREMLQSILSGKAWRQGHGIGGHIASGVRKWESWMLRLSSLSPFSSA